MMSANIAASIPMPIACLLLEEEIMKKIISVALSIILLAAILIACNGDGNSVGDIDSGDYLKEYKSTFSSAITSMNQYTTTGTSDYTFISNIIDGLVEADKYGRPAPALAESWEHNDDCSVWTFHLRDGVYWVDDTGKATNHKVTANDFVAGIRYIAEPKHNASSFNTISSVIKGLEDYYDRIVDIDDGIDSGMTREEAIAAFDDEVGVKAVDELIVEYTLEGSCPYFLSYAQTDMLLPVNQEFLNEVGDDYGIAKNKILYNGGYYISQWNLDKQITLTKNEHYWDVDNLTLDVLSWEYVSDGISSLELFERGDITSTSMTSEEVASVRGSEWEKYVYLSEKTVTTYWYSFNFTSRNPEMAAAVQNENFRKAIFTAIDSNTLSAIWEPNNPEFFVRHTLLPENVIIDESGVDYTDYPAIKPYKDNDPFNANQAKKYMDRARNELTEADGKTLTGVTAGHVDMLPVTEFDVDGKFPIDIVYASTNSEYEMKKASLVKQMLENYLGTENVNVILGYSTNSFSADVYDLNNYDMVDDSYGFRYADPSANLNRLTSDRDITASYYSIPEYDRMIAKADGVYDINQHYEAYSEAEAWILEHAYIKPYMSGGGSYHMTRIIPYTVPGGYFGMGRYKMKGALVRKTPVTSDEYAKLTEQYKKEVAKLDN